MSHTSSKMPLTFLPAGQHARVVDILGGQGFRNRLSELGLIKGSKVQLISNDRGPLIVGIGDTRLALGRGMAQKVVVAIEESTEDRPVRTFGAS